MKFTCVKCGEQRPVSEQWALCQCCADKDVQSGIFVTVVALLAGIGIGFIAGMYVMHRIAYAT